MVKRSNNQNIIDMPRQLGGKGSNFSQEIVPRSNGTDLLYGWNLGTHLFIHRLCWFASTFVSNMVAVQTSTSVLLSFELGIHDSYFHYFLQNLLPSILPGFFLDNKPVHHLVITSVPRYQHAHLNLLTTPSSMRILYTTSSYLPQNFSLSSISQPTFGT